MKVYPVRTAVWRSPPEPGSRETELHGEHPHGCFSLFPLEIDVRSRSRTWECAFLERTTSEAREVQASRRMAGSPLGSKKRLVQYKGLRNRMATKPGA